MNPDDERDQLIELAINVILLALLALIIAGTAYVAWLA